MVANHCLLQVHASTMVVNYCLHQVHARIMVANHCFHQVHARKMVAKCCCNRGTHAQWKLNAVCNTRTHAPQKLLVLPLLTHNGILKGHLSWILDAFVLKPVRIQKPKAKIYIHSDPHLFYSSQRKTTDGLDYIKPVHTWTSYMYSSYIRNTCNYIIRIITGIIIHGHPTCTLVTQGTHVIT